MFLTPSIHPVPVMAAQSDWTPFILVAIVFLVGFASLFVYPYLTKREARTKGITGQLTPTT